MLCNVVSHYGVVGVGRFISSLEAGRVIKLGQAHTLWISRDLEGSDRPCDEAMKWEWDGSAGNTSTHRRGIKGAGGVDGCGQHVAPGLERGTQQSSQGVA
jgi:hypothetical protein